MIRTALSRAAAIVAARTSAKLRPSLLARSPPSRLLHDGINANPVALQMINYAVSLARSQKSDESYGQAQLVLEQCLSSQPSEGQDLATHNSRAMVLMAMSTLLSERGKLDEAIEKLQKVEDLSSSSVGVRIAALEALVGLHLELKQDHTSSVLADKCLELAEKNDESSDSEGYTRAVAVKGLVELVHGNLGISKDVAKGELFIREVERNVEEVEEFTGSTALFFGELLHARQSYEMAKKVYQKIIQNDSRNEEFSDPSSLAAGNMSSDKVLLAATCALGQLEAHAGNFGDAEEILTRALTKTEEHFGSHHPKVGVILTCIALMFRRKAVQEHSSSILIQEGLYRRAIDLLKAPAFEAEGAEAKADRSDIVALARGGYADVLCVQQNRKDQGEKMKKWAEAAWGNRRLSLAEALDVSNTDKSLKVPIVDARISRVL
ncbi:PREDICTED: uncharacterized protein LOC101313816 [Fragaria vesca subsp. vesca]|uniref:uncharacterized protein LOC101313816 n=1 Tax=Fragaria vesca subsp. vesca TaxID=101020 RepID=UPI0002C31905|nr:PREDICTED: uncharacterized protein LOC101313816 [Fragaria vesca subsp. vesca]